MVEFLRGGNMARAAREKSNSGIYHIMIRGINKQLILEDNEDNQKLLEVLKECKVLSEYKIYAYCFMGNHIHLLLKVEKENLEQIFKRIGARYVYYYNWKYKRSGHLFQDRFKSEPIDDDSYLLKPDVNGRIAFSWTDDCLRYERAIYRLKIYQDTTQNADQMIKNGEWDEKIYCPYHRAWSSPVWIERK